MSEPETASNPALGGHSGQWGLSAILIGSLVMLAFPMVVGLEFGSLAGAYNSPDYVTLAHIDLGVIGAYSLVAGVFVLAGLSLLSAIIGLRHAARSRQPAGLAVGGFFIGVSAVLLTALLLIITNECATWVRGWQKELIAIEAKKQSIKR